MDQGLSENAKKNHPKKCFAYPLSLHREPPEVGLEENRANPPPVIGLYHVSKFGEFGGYLLKSPAPPAYRCVSAISSKG